MMIGNHDGSVEPLLPPGSIAQPAWGFHDASGGWRYEFVRVYGPARLLPGRAGIDGQVLDEGASYWLATRAADGRRADATATSRWITFGEARRKRASLSFASFASVDEMRGALPEALDLPPLPSIPGR